jgi:hypothetical protein
VPDLQQLAVLAFALVPGFIASEVQSFVALRRRPPALETTLMAILYSAVLYLASTVGHWGPQFDSHFAVLASGQPLLAAFTAPSLLARYLGLIGAAVLLGLLTGRSLVWGYGRAVLALLTGRNVIGSTWQEFFHDRPTMGLWVELRDRRRIVGEVASASDSLGERVVSLRWPSILDTNGDPVLMNLDRLLIDTNECILMGILPASALPNRTLSLGQRIRGWLQGPR